MDFVSARNTAKIQLECWKLAHLSGSQTVCTISGQNWQSDALLRPRHGELSLGSEK